MDKDKIRRILIVDDDKDFSLSLADILESRNFIIKMAHSEKSALEKIEKFAADVALVDIRLGQGSGINVTRSFSKMRPDTLCIMMTAYAAVETAVEALQEGAYDYLRKPFNTKDLLKTLDRCFEKIMLEHDKKDAEQKLAESEKKYRRIFENIQDVYYETDMKGVILEVSPSVESLYYYKILELVGKSVYDFFDDPNHVLGFVNNLQEKGQIFDQDVMFRDKKDNYRPCSLNVRLVYDQRNVPDRIIGSLRDKTESHKLEEQLRHAQKIEAIGRLAGGVAHDFNNILTVINGYSEFMLGQLDEHDPMSVNLQEIIQAVGRAESLTRQLLAFSRKQILKPVVLSINDTIRSMEKMLKRLIGEDVQLITNLSKDIGNIRTDPGQIEQVIMNLAVNARDAMPRGGKLTIRTEEKKILQKEARKMAEIEEGTYVVISLKDSGIGVDKETQSRIFEPFFTTKEISKGTGLGLSTVYGIIKQSGGNIFVESEPGKGALFTIYLPQVKESVTERIADKSVEHKLRGQETILVVEDEGNLRHLICESLRSFGYNILDASHGGNALLICERYTKPIHLILTDVVMPQMSGAELVQRLLELHPEMKVLYMSGYTDDAVVKHGIEHKQTDFIQKPFKLHDLVQNIRSVLDEKLKSKK